MKVLVVGSGAREHALVWKLQQSPAVDKIYCANGNAGMAKIADCVSIAPDAIEDLLVFAKKEQIDMTVVGPEVPLVAGISDRFKAEGLKVFGPDKACSRLEGSKIYAKDFMQRYDIPTANYQAFNDPQDALLALEEFFCPLVIKADGLAAGKGVLICQTHSEARQAILDLMTERRFGEAGAQIVIEDYMEGIEASLLCFVSDNRIIPMESARDYKKAQDGDQGLNTGGMGSFSPNNIFTAEVITEIEKNVLKPTSEGLTREGLNFCGVLFIGLMMTNTGIKVLEYNVRFGDPEAEVVLPRLESDLFEVLQKTIDGSLQAEDLQWSNQACLTVIGASGGYPQAYEKGKVITGFNALDPDCLLFHAGTKTVDNKIVTSGGRVLAVTALGNNLEEARQKAYHNIKHLDFEGMFYRHDIGKDCS